MGKLWLLTSSIWLHHAKWNYFLVRMGVLFPHFTSKTQQSPIIISTFVSHACMSFLSWGSFATVTEPTSYTKLSKKITRQSRRFSELKPVQPGSPLNHEGFQTNSRTSQDRNKFSGHHHILYKSLHHKYIRV
jgi:hypothetical protein